MQNPPAVIEIENQLLLPLPDGVKFTSRRLEMPENLTRSQLLDIGRFLNKSGESLDFWRADYIERCRKTLGDDDTKDLLRQLQFPQADFKKAQLLAGLTVRDPELNSEHHFILAKAALDETGRNMWATLAKENHLSGAELQESIKKGTVTRITPNDGSGAGGVTTWGGIRMQFELIKRRIGNEWKTWDAAQCDTVLAQLGGILAFAGELAWRKRELLKNPPAAPIEKPF